MKTLAFARHVGNDALDYGHRAFDFSKDAGSRAFDFSKDAGARALDYGMERRKTVLAVIGGIAVVVAAGVIVARVLRARAEARTSEDSTETPKAAKPTSNKFRGAGGSQTIAKAAKL